MLTLQDLHDHYQRYEAAYRRNVENFEIGNKVFDFNREKAIMGVVNLSRDSWYRESVCTTVEQAVRRAQALHAQGAHLIDLGAESTLPNADIVAANAQTVSILPVLELLHKAGIAVSVETYHAPVARACLAAGAALINLTGKQASREIYECIAEYDAAVIICYVQGNHVRDVSNFDGISDPIPLMLEYFKREIDLATSVGVKKIVIDAGLGFYYKNLQDSRQRIRFQMQTFLDSVRLRQLGFPVCQALPHAFEYFGEEVRCAEPFFAVFASLGKTDLLRTHEVAKIKAVLDTLGSY
jgi:dihydropteroate synthase